MTKVLTFSIMVLTACLLCVDTTSRLSLHCVTAPLLMSLIVSLPATRLPRYCCNAVLTVTGELALAICAVDVYCQEFFQTPITPQILSSVLLSDSRETGEFVASFFGTSVLSHWRIAALLFLMLLLLISTLLARCISERVMLKRKVWMVVVGLCAIYELSPSCKFAQLFLQSDDMQALEGLIFRQYHEEVPTPVHRLAFACFSLRQSSRQLEEVKRATYSAQVDSCTHLSPHIVLVIGESYNKHHSTLYGYRLPTTPLQQSRMDNGELLVFDDVVTPWNITSNVFLDLFSTCSQRDANRTESRLLFPILFRRAGYSVNFFSNQYLLRGFRKGATNQAGHFFLADQALSDSLFSYRNAKSSKYDMGLVGQVVTHLDTAAEHPFTLDIIHLIGQHFEYSLRYPQESASFTAEDYQVRGMGKEATTTVMHYDNATHYNDLVLDSILNVYRDQEAIVLFVADHGEEVYDETPVHGRLFGPPTSATARQEFQVPMWIWCSKRYRDEHPSVVLAIAGNSTKPFITSDLSHLLLHLAGIKCKAFDNQRDILYHDYQVKSRIIAGAINFDELVQ